MPEEEPTPEDKPKGKRKLWIIPAELPFSWDSAKATAGRFGMNPFARRIVTGWFSTQMAKLRIDQVHGLLSSGGFLADLVDENNPPKFGTGITRALGRFVNLRSLADRIDTLVTPELIAHAVKDGNVEVYSLIINSPSGGKKWFYDQTVYMKDKLRAIIQNMT